MELDHAADAHDVSFHDILFQTYCAGRMAAAVQDKVGSQEHLQNVHTGYRGHGPF